MQGYTPRVGALVVTWNRKSDALDCVRSLLRSTYRNLTIYVVDNASTDGTLQSVAEQYPQVRLIRSEENLGFAGGNNVGLSTLLEDGMDAAFLVNDDVVVADDALERLIDGGFYDQNVGVTASKVLLYSQPEIIWSAGGLIDPHSGVSIQRHYGETDSGQAEGTVEVDYAVGCAMLVKSDAIRKVGFLDPRYYMYYEESDWCRRIRDAGYRILYVSKSRVWHKVTLTNNGRNNSPYYYARNRLLYLSSSGLPQGKVAWIAFTDIMRSAAGHAVHGRLHESRLMSRGVLDYFTRRYGKFKDRQ